MAGTAVFDTGTETRAASSWLAVGICVFINMLDGFDILAMAFTAPVIADAWTLTPTQLGVLFSAGLAGMTLGSLALSPIADTWGRRAVLLLCLSIITVGMLLSALASGHLELAFFRFLTGLGIGGLLSGINTVAAEYAPARQRNFAIGLVTSAYPVGATLGGIAAIPLIRTYGWESVFVLGGLLSLVMIPIVYFALPESLAFLLSRKPRNALVRANAILRRFNAPTLAALPEIKRTGVERQTLVDIARPGLRVGTALICGAFFMNMLTFYFLMSWVPKLVVDMGLSTDIGITASVLINLFGTFGGGICGYLASRANLGKVTAICMVLMFAAMIAFALMPPVAAAVLAASAVLGFFMIGTMVGLYAIVAHVFPTHVRATGTGAAIGLGRLGAVAGPYLGGVLIAAGWSRPLYFALLGIPTLIAAVLTVFAARRAREIETL